MILALIGSFFVLMASVGLLRMPDSLSRLQTATLASSFGTLLTLLGASFAASDWLMWVCAAIAIAFLMIAQPVGVALLGRSTIKGDSSESKL